MRIKSLILAAAVALSACAGIPGAQTPQQAVLGLQGAYRTALIPAVTYVELPRCTPAKATLCSQPAVVALIQKATRVAELAVDTADTAAYTPGISAEAQRAAVTSAETALKTLTLTTPKGAK